MNPPTLRNLLSGQPQAISQRLRPCGCGCQGRDPWHAKVMTRKVRNLRVLDAPVKARGGDFSLGIVEVAAVGEYKHPAGTMLCGLMVRRLSDGRLAALFWVRLDSHWQVDEDGNELGAL